MCDVCRLPEKVCATDVRHTKVYIYSMAYIFTWSLFHNLKSKYLQVKFLYRRLWADAGWAKHVARCDVPRSEYLCRKNSVSSAQPERIKSGLGASGGQRRHGVLHPPRERGIVLQSGIILWQASQLPFEYRRRPTAHVSVAQLFHRRFQKSKKQ